jgi:hypothetical protein
MCGVAVFEPVGQGYSVRTPFSLSILIVVGLVSVCSSPTLPWPPISPPRDRDRDLAMCPFFILVAAYFALPSLFICNLID